MCIYIYICNVFAPSWKPYLKLMPTILLGGSLDLVTPLSPKPQTLNRLLRNKGSKACRGIVSFFQVK